MNGRSISPNLQLVVGTACMVVIAVGIRIASPILGELTERTSSGGDPGLTFTGISGRPLARSVARAIVDKLAASRNGGQRVSTGHNALVQIIILESVRRNEIQVGALGDVFVA
jgi:hypothetical protein